MPVPLTEVVSYFAMNLLLLITLNKESSPSHQGSNSVISSNWLKKLEWDLMIGHYFPVMLAHYVTTQLRIRSTDQFLEHVEQQLRAAQVATSAMASC